MSSLSSIIDFKNGKIANKNGSCYPVYGGNGIIGYSSEYNYENVLVIGRVGANCGSVHYNIGKCWVSDNALAGIPLNKSLLFDYYLLKTLDLNKAHIGSSQPLLTQNILNNVNVEFTNSESEQKAIAKVLSDLDAKIGLNNKINRELEAMAKTFYDYWFVQFDFPNEQGKPYKSSGGKMVYNKELKREIPEGWEVKELGKCIKIFDSQRIPLSNKERKLKKGTIPYYGATGIMDYVNDFIFNEDYILLAEDGSVMNENGFPIIQFIWGKTWVNNHAHVIQANDKEQNEFYFQHLSRIPVVLIKTGSIQMKINQDNLKNFQIIVPPSNVINRYSKIANSTRKSLINNIEVNQQLTALRDWLLPMLMNGQVTVGEAEEKLSMAAEPQTEYKKG